MTDEMDVPLNIKVSGHAVYKAVANFLKNNPKLKKKIGDDVDQILRSDAMKSLVEKCVKERLVYLDIKEEIQKQVKAEVAKQVKDFLTKQKLQDVVKQVLGKLIVT